jgi:hypothetical protein
VTDLVDALRRLLGDLEAVGGGHAIVGALVTSMSDRGFARGRDLMAALDALRTSGAL